jgi:hypothetical protein
MNDNKERKSLGTQECPQYKSKVTLFIELRNGRRHLVAQYENGGYEGRKDFAAGIPDDWTDGDVGQFVRMPGSGAYPVWEFAARTKGSPMLMWPLGFGA